MATEPASSAPATQPIQALPAGEPADISVQINQELYKRNFELAIRNQTLTTLRRLYELTNSTLAVQALSERLAFTLTENLRLEMTGVFLVDQATNTLKQIAVATSDRLQGALDQAGIQLDQISLPINSKDNAIAEAWVNGKQSTADSMAALYRPLFDEALLHNIEREANVKSAIIYPLYTENKKIGALVMTQNKAITDITEFEKDAMDRFVEVIAVSLDKALVYEELKMLNEKLRELDTAKSEFMSIASHQLRTPLAGIVGYLSMLVEGDYGNMEEGQMTVMKEIYSASQRLVRLVNTFLNVTRIEAGRFTMNFTESDLVELLTAEVKELQPTADKKNVKLVYTAPNIKIMGNVDADKVRDVFLNLIDNAIKYTPEGTVSAFIEQRGDKAHFWVKDSGVGIEPTEAAGLFQKFVRGNGIARVQPNGSGLGLYIVKKIVESHHGKVWVESEGPGKGSTFNAEIPLQQPKPVETVPASAQPTAPVAAPASATPAA